MVEPSESKRIVELSQFGIVVQIPENYRTLLRNSGDVWVLSPVDYDMITCWVRGGRGLYASTVRGVSHPNNLSLNALATN